MPGEGGALLLVVQAEELNECFKHSMIANASNALFTGLEVMYGTAEPPRAWTGQSIFAFRSKRIFSQSQAQQMEYGSISPERPGDSVNRRKQKDPGEGRQAAWRTSLLACGGVCGATVCALDRPR